MLKIALSGCNGRMGRVIADIVSARDNMQIVAGFDINTAKNGDFPVFADPFEFQGGCDVIIDFSNASSTEHLLAYCEQHHTPVVICTTGHSAEQLAKIREASTKIPVFSASSITASCTPAFRELKRKWGLIWD